MSHVSFSRRLADLSKVLTIFVLVALFAAAVLVVDRGGPERTMTVDFPQTTALYEGSDVRILGVPVGKVESLTPRGDVIRVELSYDGDVQLPRDVQAVVVSPAIVGDRFVQLTPAYEAGPELEDEAHLPVDRTAVPVELDEVYKSLDDLALALGPDGANRDGALSDLLADSATQLDGQGGQLNQTIRNFSDLGTTLADNSDELFGSVRQISGFVQMLERNDAVVRSFNDNTARVAEVLAGEREDLAATLSTLSTALISVEGLVRDNRGTLRTNVANLRAITETLAKREGEINDITIAGPTALSNVALAYNGQYGTLDTHADLAGSGLSLLEEPWRLICMIAQESVSASGLCSTVDDLLTTLGLTDLRELIFGALPRTAVVNSPDGSDLAALLGVQQ